MSVLLILGSLDEAFIEMSSHFKYSLTSFSKLGFPSFIFSPGTQGIITQKFTQKPHMQGIMGNHLSIFTPLITKKYPATLLSTICMATNYYCCQILILCPRMKMIDCKAMGEFGKAYCKNRQKMNITKCITAALVLHYKATSKNLRTLAVRLCFNNSNQESLFSKLI